MSLWPARGGSGNGRIGLPASGLALAEFDAGAWAAGALAKEIRGEAVALGQPPGVPDNTVRAAIIGPISTRVRAWTQSELAGTRGGIGWIDPSGTGDTWILQLTDGELGYSASPPTDATTSMSSTRTFQPWRAKPLWIGVVGGKVCVGEHPDALFPAVPEADAAWNADIPDTHLMVAVLGTASTVSPHALVLSRYQP